MEKENCMVFEYGGVDAEWDQHSIPMTLERAREFLESTKKLYPDRSFKILQEIEG